MTATVWKDDGHGIVEAGDVGGDVQAGKAYSRRFVHERLAGRHIEVRAYPVYEHDMGDPDNPSVRLEVQTELMVATDPDDPGGTEVWSDLEYSDLPEKYDREYSSATAAGAAALGYLRQLDPALHFTWDGRPEMGPASVLVYGEMLGKLAHQFSAEQLSKHHSVVSYVQRIAIDNNSFEHHAIKLNYWYRLVVDPQGNAWRVAWLMDETRCLNTGEGEGGWVIGVYWEPFIPTHTHYNPYGPPLQAPGTLVGCANVRAHDATRSELWADYRYDPHLVPSPVTGLPGHMEVELKAAYMRQRAEDTVYAITDVVPDTDLTYLVTLTNRTSHSLDEPGPTWHTETWGLYPDRGWAPVLVNPHPGIEHMRSHCPNCGH